LLLKILMVAHIGETLGHLVRGLAIADELTALGIKPEIAASSRARDLLQTWHQHYKHYNISWDWSHNAIHPAEPLPAYIAKVLVSNRQVVDLLDTVLPDLVVGLPGVFTTQAARSRRILHASILHGPYLSPIINLPNPTPTESIVLEFAQKIACGGSFDFILSHLSRKLRLPKLTYQEYLETEPIFVPQPGLPIPDQKNLYRGGFIRASFGPPLDDTHLNLDQACYITFGSGNPCDITRVVELARSIYPSVIVSTSSTSLKRIPGGVISRPFIASSSLAGRVAAVVSHGGIGTVGTFAEHRTPQLIIPTEIDQATMAVHAGRLGIARQCGLDAWARKPRLGRHIPEFNEEDLLSALEALRTSPMGPENIVSSGASEIASQLLRLVEFRNWSSPTQIRKATGGQV
jgi:UDP:flavonoid glycosyltransferase YjiC (YdhE family)